MDPLIRFLIVNAAGGFFFGLLAGVAFIVSIGMAGLFLAEPIGAGMILWAFSASFAMAAIGTGLAMLSTND
jgi:hypothetical protein